MIWLCHKSESKKFCLTGQKTNVSFKCALRMPKVCGFWHMVVAALQWQAILNVYVLLVRDALTSIYAENSHASQTAGISAANL